MFCRNCGTDMGESNFCPNCGQSSNPYIPMNGEKTVNKVAYALLGIFLGTFGIHRFYAGKVISGIIYLLFCWTGIPSLLGLIEGIIALTRDDDGRGNIPVRKDSYFV